MKLAGKLDDVVCESSRPVTEAIVIPVRIALDWIENGATYHLLAHSQDGRLTYQGTYEIVPPGERMDRPDHPLHRPGSFGCPILRLARKGLGASGLRDVHAGTEQVTQSGILAEVTNANSYWRVSSWGVTQDMEQRKRYALNERLGRLSPLLVSHTFLGAFLILCTSMVVPCWQIENSAIAPTTSTRSPVLKFLSLPVSV